MGKNRMDKILVTGGMGFIGSNFIRYLISKHDFSKIINLDNLSLGSNTENLKDIEDRKNYVFHKGSITDEDTLYPLIQESDVIVNFAAETHVDRSISNPVPFFESNIRGVFNILEALRKNGKDIKFIQISTDEVYGEILEGSFTEESKLNPSNPYSATKASADMLILSYCKTYGIDASITRSTNNFGPYQFPEKLIPKTIIRGLKGLKIPVYGAGKNIRDWIYVWDHCHAIDLVMGKGEAGEIYNISTGNEVGNTELVKNVLNILGKTEDLIEFVEDRPGHDFRYSLDSSKIRNALDWEPKFSFQDALEKTVSWYLENEDWWQDLDRSILRPRPWKKTIR